jgi:hypothetical protein
MKRITILLAVVMLCATAARADEGKPMTTAGNGAWMFTFSGLSSFGISGAFAEGIPAEYVSGIIGGTGNFNGNGGGTSPAIAFGSGYNVPGIGMRYFISNGMAVRGGLALGSLSQSSKNGTANLSDNTSSALILGIVAMIEKHFEGLGAVSPYLGGGIHFGMASVGSKNYMSSTTTMESNGSATTLDIIGALGMEWFFMNHVSLGGEYRLGVGMLSGSRTDKQTGNPDNEVKFPSYFKVGTSALSVMLSIYP